MGVVGRGFPPSLASLGVPQEGCACGFVLAGAAHDALSAIHWARLRMCGHLSPVFFSLKYIAQCQEGTGGSFPPLGQGGEPGDKPGTCSPTLCPSHLKGKQSRNAPKRVSFGPVVAVINPFPPPQPLAGAQQLGAGRNEAPGCSRAGAACPAPVPKRPLALLGGVSTLPDGRELPAWLRWLLSSAVAWLGPPAAGAALLGISLPSLLSAGALSFGLWGNPGGGAEAF